MTCFYKVVDIINQHVLWQERDDKSASILVFLQTPVSLPYQHLEREF